MNDGLPSMITMLTLICRALNIITIVLSSIVLYVSYKNKMREVKTSLLYLIIAVAYTIIAFTW